MDTREKLVELINYARDSRTGQELSERIADYLISNGVTVQEWISVEDRLPPYEQLVLVADFRDDYISISKLRAGGKCLADSLDCIEQEQFFALSEITHWLPIPKPPKGE